MKLAIYSVFDVKAQKFATPFFLQNDLIATRSFTRAVNDPSTDLCAFPADFALYSIGEFDDASAAIDVHAQPLLIVSALNVKEK
ncbi:MAG: nonstructural protein [Microvirus sp.]|nr:MAG: nonstructural protein [Microvirus sp.]